MRTTTSFIKFIMPGRRYQHIPSQAGSIKATVIMFCLCFNQYLQSQTDTTVRTRRTQTSDTTVIMKSREGTGTPKPAPRDSAREDNDDQFYRGEFGLRFLPTFTSIEFQTIDQGTAKGEFTLGYGFGAMFAHNFTRNAGIQFEIIYNSLTQKYKDRSLDRQVDISYINFPLMLSLNTDKGRRLNLNFVAGPQMGYNIGSSVRTTGGGDVDTVQAVLAVRKGDFGFAYGAGLEIKLNESGNFRFDLGFRGVYGLVNINDDSGTRQTNSYYILEKSRIRTNSLYLGFAWLF
jgi:hypothetical protein